MSFVIPEFGGRTIGTSELTLRSSKMIIFDSECNHKLYSFLETPANLSSLMVLYDQLMVSVPLQKCLTQTGCTWRCKQML